MFCFHILPITRAESLSGQVDVPTSGPQTWALLREGQDLDQAGNPSLAVSKYELAASGVGEPAGISLNKLGTAYLEGRGVSRDIVKAVKYFSEAAALGNPDGQYMLGILYGAGLHSVKPNITLSLLNLHFAAQGGHVGAQMAMGYRYLHGLDVPKNCKTAALYYELASNQAVDGRLASPVPILNEQDRLSKLDARAAKGGVNTDAEVVQYYTYAAERGEVMAVETLGQLQFYGARGMAQDYAAAAEQFRAAAARDDSSAMNNLGHMHAHGLGVERDDAAAVAWFRRAAEAGHSAAQNGLGYMQLHGRGGEPASRRRALQNFKKAAEQGNVDALYNVGVLFLSGGRPLPAAHRAPATATQRAEYALAEASYSAAADPAPRDFTKAFKYLSVASHHGHTLATHKLGQMNLHGMGTTRNCAAAVTQLKKVAERGPWVRRLKRAFRAYTEGGDATTALRLYVHAAEQGYESAQSNAAWLLARGKGYGSSDLPAAPLRIRVPTPPPAAAAEVAAVETAAEAVPAAAAASPNTPNTAPSAGAALAPEAAAAAAAVAVERERVRLSLRYFKQAARQGNVLARLRIGDAYYYGYGNSTPNYAKAASHYRSASDANNAQATFNLGYMHQHARGLPRDFHLAKRFYDRTLALQPGKAYVPVKLALAHLHLHHLWRRYSRGELSTRNFRTWFSLSPANDAAASAQQAATAAAAAAKAGAGGGGAAAAGATQSSQQQQQPPPPPLRRVLHLFGSAVAEEDLGLALLCLFLAIAVQLYRLRAARWQRQQQRLRAAQQQQAQQAAAAVAQ